MATPHNSANIGDIAETVLMCGDPLRIKYIAEKFLENPVCFNTVRGMLGFTGTYKGKRISVMGHGMGIPSMAIYVTELINVYGVKTIIRAGSAGAISHSVELRDIVIAQGACTDSSFAWQFDIPGTFAPIGDYGLLKAVDAQAESMGLDVKVGNIYSTDVFYAPDGTNERFEKMGVLAVEMEAAGLYMLAAKHGVRALCVCTISDHLAKQEFLSTEERQTGFDKMLTLCLETVCKE